MPVKTCIKCHTQKPLSDFIKQKLSKDGHTNVCKICRRIYYTKPISRWGKKHQELLYKASLSPLLDGFRLCLHCGKAKLEDEFYRYSNGVLHGSCKDCKRAASKRWKTRNKDKIKEYNAAYRQANQAKFQQLWAEWYSKNRDSHLAKNRHKSKSAKRKLDNINKQARRRTLERQGDVDVAYMEQMFEIQTICAYCGEPFNTKRKPTIDHVVPISKGGTHTRSNITLACRICNSSKNDRLIEPTFDMVLKSFSDQEEDR